MPPRVRADQHQTELSPARKQRQSGIILLDVVLALGLIGLVLLLIMPAFQAGTSPARQAGYAARVAAILKEDRNAAARTGTEVVTSFRLSDRRVISGSSPRSVVLPRDLTVDLISSGHCPNRLGVANIVFSPDGRSCGGVFRLAKRDNVWRIRVNWLTGFIDVERPKSS